MFYQIVTGYGLLLTNKKVLGSTEPVNNREMFYKFLQESDDLFAIVESPRTTVWREFLKEYPDVKDLIMYKMPYPISCALHSEQSNVEGFPGRRRTILIILKGKKYEDQAGV